jgi:predicted CXXCH cytochrome family protein
MNHTTKIAHAVAVARQFLQQPSNLLWAAGGGAGLALVLMSCGTTTRTMMVAPHIPGAEFAGSDACAQCHEEVTRDFRTADHAKLMAKGSNAVDMGCESCHGPGSKHIESGGAAGTIHNPDKSADTCFQCHVDVKAQFSLPYSHPVLSGKMTCTECHDPHKGNAIKGGGTQLHGKNETCAECHRAQTQHFVFAHDAVKEGCSTCHNPHGSVNQKMLTERNATLCLKCHVDVRTAPTGNMGPSGGHAGRFLQGNCWAAGCHEAVHGSNTNIELRF